jgi:hypothetical protein
VEFFTANESLGTATLSANAEDATASIEVSLAPGIHPVIARYLGNSTFAFSIAAPPAPIEVLPESSAQ